VKVTLTIGMPYLAKVSVNAAYYPHSYKKRPVVEEWLLQLRSKMNLALFPTLLPPTGRVELNITMRMAPRPGRPPDVSNFRKLPQDVIAAAMGVDDWIFFGTDELIWDKTCTESKIVFDLLWTTEEES